MGRLSNHQPQVVVITGASAGVGRAAAVAFAKRGARLGLIARGRERLHEAVEEVHANGGEAIALPADVARAREIERSASIVEDRFGPIDVWVNNAMTSVFSRVSDMQPREYRRVTEVTYLGVVHGTLAALHRMKRAGPAGRGCIVQVGSALCYRAIPLQSAYCAAKHAIIGFTDSLRCELIDEGSDIHLTVVHLPAVNTPQFGWVKSRLPSKAQPVPPIFQPEIAADAIVYASQNRRREVLLGMPTVKATMGQKFIPGWLDHYLAENAIDGQQTNEPEDPNRPHNLWRPVPGHHGAHGEFDDRAKCWSGQWVLSKHRSLAGVLAGAAVIAIGGALAARKNANGREMTARRRIAEREGSVMSSHLRD